MSSDDTASALEEARAVLDFLLTDGPMRASTLKARASDALVSQRTLRRAKKDLGVQSRKIGAGQCQYWVWELPPGKAADRLHHEFRERELDDLVARLFHGDEHALGYHSCEFPGEGPSVNIDDEDDDESDFQWAK